VKIKKDFYISIEDVNGNIFKSKKYNINNLPVNNDYRNNTLHWV